jgi:hypothetical protein
MKNFLGVIFPATAVCSIVTDFLTYSDIQRAPNIPGLNSLIELLQHCVIKNALTGICIGHTIAEDLQGIL